MMADISGAHAHDGHRHDDSYWLAIGILISIAFFILVPCCIDWNTRRSARRREVCAEYP